MEIVKHVFDLGSGTSGRIWVCVINVLLEQNTFMLKSFVEIFS